MKKLFASLLAALMLCAGLTQYAFAAENIPDDQPNQPPVEENNDDEQGKKPSQPPKNDGEEGKPVPYDFVDGPKGDGN